ncbi:Rossmann-like and DUF2520 domain-containing protein [Fibrivirga algicola]|uniref:DUF2520 domain-containing protein n=1 Tax=Fibrivirga algicola TaxID=2950420 RepID=A0ABX0QHN0_9BACT|nr:Rossmann-like and DUF2520 domain-containing protein [Fibrivirga algicola]NID10363.1 DUF2520 domain-containing protein [Fibrivirga algicola]
MTITVIGAGNVAWHLAPALENAGHHILAVYSRQLTHARQLASMLYDARPISDLNLADNPSQLFVLAVPDNALDDVCARLVLPENATLVHTSGGLSLEKLQKLMSVYSDVPVKTGVFYPLQTFSRGRALLDFEQIPLCIEADNLDTQTQLVTMGQEMSTIVYLVNSAERRSLHVAAVLACNFTNHLMALAKDVTDEEDLEFDLLKPLIRETVRKALDADHPANVQTGPARRHDTQVIENHLAYLRPRPDVARLYEVLTDHIRRRY